MAEQRTSSPSLFFLLLFSFLLSAQPPAQAASLPADELEKRSWDIGVMQRAYYVVGADMAKTIEGKAGRKALIDTITKGPRSFVTTYNALVPSAEKIVELR